MSASALKFGEFGPQARFLRPMLAHLLSGTEIKGIEKSGSDVVVAARIDFIDFEFTIPRRRSDGVRVVARSPFVHNQIEFKIFDYVPPGRWLFHASVVASTAARAAEAAYKRGSDVATKIASDSFHHALDVARGS